MSFQETAPKEEKEVDTPVSTENGEQPPAEQPVEEEKPVDLAKARQEFQEKARTYLLEQARHVVIPSYAKWFDLDAVHSIEKKSFPDFFPQKVSEESVKSTYKTAEVYKNMRDFMINSYRINPIEYLTVTAVRRNLAGDVSSIIRIHKFLEKWGLINYQIDPRTKSAIVGPQYTGHFQVTLDTPKGLIPFVPEDAEVALPSPPESESETTDPKEEKVSAPGDAIPLNLEVRRNVYSEAAKKNANSAIQYFCSITGEDVSDVRYHNLKSKSSSAGNINSAAEISQKAFDQGLFPSNFVSSDFVKLTKDHAQEAWSEQEVLLLLEGVEMYATYDNQSRTLFANNAGQWDKIADHIGSKTREQALIKFVQLPIEDRYLSKLVSNEPSEFGETGLNRETIIQDVVERIVSSQQGKEVVELNALKNVQELVVSQTALINQVIELTLEKVQTKLQLINNVESNLIKTENLLNLQRKQLLIERWLNYEKISKFKQHNADPALTELLDDLLTPVSISEVNKTFNKVNLSDKTPQDASKVETAAHNELPISVVKPKSYQFWSA